jgi:N-acetylglucosamine malate deacetylase 1
MNKVLVVAPHADDEVLGCAATMAKHVSNGDKVWVLVMTNAAVGAPELFSPDMIEMIRAEALRAHAVLGVRDTIFLDFPAPALNAYPEYRMSSEVGRILNEIRPTHLYLPHPGDIHQDHAAVYRASLVAARPQGNNKVESIYCYETLSETEWAPMQGHNSFIPNHFVDVSGFFEKKVEAMSEFKSQLREFPHPRSIEALNALASFRGATVGVNRAEAFEVERQIA